MINSNPHPSIDISCLLDVLEEHSDGEDISENSFEMECNLRFTYFAPEVSNCLAISSGLYVGFMVVTVMPTPAAPRNATQHR